MKGFKRFGGEFSGNGDSGNFTVATIGVVLLVVCCVAGLAVGAPSLVVLGFGLLFVFTIASTFFGGSVGASLLQERMNKQLVLAGLQFKSKNYRGCIAALEKARKYGSLPTRYSDLYTQTERLIDRS